MQWKLRKSNTQYKELIKNLKIEFSYVDFKLHFNNIAEIIKHEIDSLNRQQYTIKIQNGYSRTNKYITEIRPWLM